MLWIKDWNWSLARFRSEVFSLLISCSRAAASHSANLLRKILQDYKHHLNTKLVTLTMCILLPWVGFVFTVNLCVLKNNNKKTTQDDTSSSCKKSACTASGLDLFLCNRCLEGGAPSYSTWPPIRLNELHLPALLLFARRCHKMSRMLELNPGSLEARTLLFVST